MYQQLVKYVNNFYQQRGKNACTVVIILSGAGFKNWGAQCRVWTLHSSEAALGFEFPPDYRSPCQGWELQWDCVSAFLPASMWFPSGLPHVKGLLRQFLGFCSEEIVLYTAVDTLCPWQEVSSRSSYVAVLSQNHSHHSDMALNLSIFKAVMRDIGSIKENYMIWWFP